MPAARRPILVIDDDALSRDLLTRTLERQGFEVIECSDGMEALQIIESGGPMLLVLDYEMPELNGAEVCEMVRLHPDPRISGLPIILLTGHAGDEHELECLRAGADDFVTKPLNTAILKARIETHLRLHAMRAQLQEQNSELEQWRQGHERDLEAASITQKAILPQRLPAIAGWELAARYQPVIQVGGDLYDWLRLPNDAWLFYIADATGHGVSAALLTTLTKLVFRHATSEATTAAGVINAVNSEFYSIFKGRSFLTAACLVVGADDDHIYFAGAGHPPLLLARETGGVELIAGQAPPIGVRAELAGEESAARVGAGDTLLLYTDGLYSRPLGNGQYRSPTELAALLPPADGSAEKYLEETLTRAGVQLDGPPLPDDVAAIALRRIGRAGALPS